MILLLQDPLAADIEIDLITNGTGSRVVVLCQDPRSPKTVRSDVTDTDRTVTDCRRLVVKGLRR